MSRKTAMPAPHGNHQSSAAARCQPVPGTFAQPAAVRNPEAGFARKTNAVNPTGPRNDKWRFALGVKLRTKPLLIG